MSKTYRKDSIDHYRPKKFLSIMGEIVDTAPTQKELIKAHSDGKKTYKPGRKAKEYLNKGRKAKVKAALGKVDDFDEMALPIVKRDHTWNWN